MKRLATLLLTLSVLLPLQAQRIHAYVSAGAITSQIEGDELKGFNHWGGTGSVGAIANLDNEGMWALAVETGYSGRGVYNNRHSAVNPYNVNITLHYIDIPLTLLFTDPYGGLRIGVGLVYSRLVQQPHDTISFRPTYFIPDTSDMTFLKNDLAPAIECRFGVWRNLQFSVRYQYSILPVKKGWTFREGDRSWSNDCYNSAATFRLIWEFGEPGHTHRRAVEKSRHDSYQQPNVRIHRR